MIWSGSGINYGHVDSGYTDSQIILDLNLLYDKGFRRIRVAHPTYSVLGLYTVQKNIINIALSKGFYVSWGLTCVNPFSDVQWAEYKTEVKTVASWAQSLRNSNFEYSIGNEEELHNDGSNAPTDSTVRSDIKTLATEVQAIYTIGPITYQTDEGNIGAWNSLGKGDLDYLGFNVYNTLPNFAYNISLIYSYFGANAYISEWNDQTGYNTTNDEDLFDKNIKNRMAIIRANNIPYAYFFTYNHTTGTWGLTDGRWNMLNEDYSTLRTAFQALTTKRRWFINI